MAQPVFAVAKISAFPPAPASASDHAERLFRRFSDDRDLMKSLRNAFTPFEVRPTELRCHDDCTTIQFEDNPHVEEMRKKFAKALGPAYLRVGDEGDGIEPLLYDPNKSKGAKFFGSIFRSSYPNVGSQLRWKRPDDGGERSGDP